MTVRITVDEQPGGRATGAPVRIEVARVSGGRDWRDACALLAEQLAWVNATVGFDVRNRQPTATTEYENPRRFYRPPAGTLVLARLDGRAAGIVGVHRLDGTTGELKRMYVRPTAHGHGLGARLVAEAVAAARDLGFCELWLETDPATMPAAVHVYRAAGFTDIAPYGDLRMDGLLTLGRNLTPIRHRIVRSRARVEWHPPQADPTPRVIGGP
jgi:GNAT superfamily N-acetyltransferase